MKIVIGSNTFGTYKRQDIAVESWQELSEKFDIDLYNIQFKDEEKFQKMAVEVEVETQPACWGLGFWNLSNTHSC